MFESYSEFSTRNLTENVDINLNDSFALIFTGGMIGDNSKNVITSKGLAKIIKTGNDKEVLKTEAKGRNSRLSSGEKTYYGMKYSVIALTPSVLKSIDMIAKFNSSIDRVDDI